MRYNNRNRTMIVWKKKKKKEKEYAHTTHAKWQQPVVRLRHFLSLSITSTSIRICCCFCSSVWHSHYKCWCIFIVHIPTYISIYTYIIVYILLFLLWYIVRARHFNIELSFFLSLLRQKIQAACTRMKSCLRLFFFVSEGI